MNKNPRRNDVTQVPAPVAPLEVAMLVGLGLLALIAAGVWLQTRGIRKDVNEKLAQLNTKVAQLTAKLEAAPAAAQQRSGQPDPNRVYPVKTAGSPAKGSATAPITIAEFSDFQ